MEVRDEKEERGEIRKPNTQKRGGYQFKWRKKKKNNKKTKKDNGKYVHKGTFLVRREGSGEKERRKQTETFQRRRGIQIKY